MEELLSQEIAEQQFESLVDYYDIDLEEANDLFEKDDKDGKDIIRANAFIKKRFISFIRKGKIEIENEGIVKQNLSKTLADKAQLTYREVDGVAKVEMAKSEKNKAEQIWRFMGYLSGIGYSKFTQMSGKDLKVAETIASLFFHI